MSDKRQFVADFATTIPPPRQTTACQTGGELRKSFESGDFSGKCTCLNERWIICLNGPLDFTGKYTVLLQPYIQRLCQHGRTSNLLGDFATLRERTRPQLAEFFERRRGFRAQARADFGPPELEVGLAEVREKGSPAFHLRDGKIPFSRNVRNCGGRFEIPMPLSLIRQPAFGNRRRELKPPLVKRDRPIRRESLLEFYRVVVLSPPNFAIFSAIFARLF